ncbi:hypothetical protein N665_0198s0159 [Sinapis alba]|nr:hypothetical protein N665_0198s0159 [Sinapis alba]
MSLPIHKLFDILQVDAALFKQMVFREDSCCKQERRGLVLDDDDDRLVFDCSFS